MDDYTAYNTNLGNIYPSPCNIEAANVQKATSRAVAGCAEQSQVVKARTRQHFSPAPVIAQGADESK